jgi:signal transduction histidine kinase
MTIQSSTLRNVPINLSLQHDVSVALRGDRILGALRWLLISAVGAYGFAFDRFRLWPPEGASWAFWACVLWALGASVVLFFPALKQMRPWLVAGDLIAFAGLAFADQQRPSAYEALIFLPLIAAGLRLRRRDLVPVSVVAAMVGMVLQFSDLGRYDITDLIRVATLVAVPWLVHLLSEQWTADNREFVRKAEQQTLTALTHAEEYRERMRALYEAAITLSATANAPSVLDAMLNECSKLVSYQSCAILLPTDVRNEVGVAAGRNLLASELKLRFMVGAGTLATVLRGGSGGVLPASAKVELTPLPSLMACQTLLVLPLRAARRTYGLLVIGSDVEQFTAEQMEMVSTLAGYSIVALQNARLSADLREERATLLDRESDMRRKLNRDLHDGPAQALAAITMNLEFINRLMEREPERVTSEMQKVIRLAQRANHEVRTLLFELRPMTLEAQGLVPTLQRYFERFADSPTRLLLHSNEVEPLDRNVQVILFNVAQEAVNNAMKHARASVVNVRLNRTNDEVTLLVEDDGKGFDLELVRENYEDRGSFGLLNIEERARLVNGTAEIQSTPGKGTTVDVRIPIE